MNKRLTLAWIVLPLCVLALAKFTIRGPLLGWGMSQDFRTFYAASRAWSEGLNPYDHGTLNSILDTAGATGGGHSWQEEPSIYPLTTYVTLSPIAQLPWRPAKLLWCLLNLTSMVVLLVCLCHLTGLSRYRLRLMLLIAGILALQPFSATLRVGQLSLIVTALGIAAVVLGEYRRKSTSGVLGAVAFALKPQVALVFFVPALLFRYWKTCLAASLTIIAIASIGVLRIHAQPGWFSLWLLHLKSAFGAAGVNSLDPTSPHHSNMLNLQYPLRVIFSNVWGVNAIAFVVGAVLVSPVLLTLSSSAKIPTFELLESLALLVVVQLLVMYHRDYDAVLLALPLAWALSPRVSPRRAWPVILLISVFFVPFLHVLYTADQWNLIRPLSSSLFWKFVVWPYQTWALLGVAGWLSYCCFRPEPTSCV